MSTNPLNTDNWAINYLKNNFSRVDKNKDGILSEEELSIFNSNIKNTYAGASLKVGITEVITYNKELQFSSVDSNAFSVMGLTKKDLNTISNNINTNGQSLADQSNAVLNKYMPNFGNTAKTSDIATFKNTFDNYINDKRAEFVSNPTTGLASDTAIDTSINNATVDKAVVKTINKNFDTLDVDKDGFLSPNELSNKNTAGAALVAQLPGIKSRHDAAKVELNNAFNLDDLTAANVALAKINACALEVSALNTDFIDDASKAELSEMNRQYSTDYSYCQFLVNTQLSGLYMDKNTAGAALVAQLPGIKSRYAAAKAEFNNAMNSNNFMGAKVARAKINACALEVSALNTDFIDDASKAELSEMNRQYSMDYGYSEFLVSTKFDNNTINETNFQGDLSQINSEPLGIGKTEADFKSKLNLFINGNRDLKLANLDTPIQASSEYLPLVEYIKTEGISKKDLSEINNRLEKGADLSSIIFNESQKTVSMSENKPISETGIDQELLMLLTDADNDKSITREEMNESGINFGVLSEDSGSGLVHGYRSLKDVFSLFDLDDSKSLSVSELSRLDKNGDARFDSAELKEAIAMANNGRLIGDKPDNVLGHFVQGETGDCWFLASLAELNQTDDGKALFKNITTDNGDGTYSVKFPGATKPYTVTEAELNTNRGPLNGKKLANGDIDVRILELALEKWRPEQPGGGNFAKLFGFKDIISLRTENTNEDGALAYLKNYDQNKNNENFFDTICMDGHVRAIKEVDTKNEIVYCVNPWDSRMIETITFDEFERKGGNIDIFPKSPEKEGAYNNIKYQAAIRQHPDKAQELYNAKLANEQQLAAGTANVVSIDSYYAESAINSTADSDKGTRLDQVNDIYITFLGRPANQDEINDWVTGQYAGQPIEYVTRAVVLAAKAQIAAGKTDGIDINLINNKDNALIKMFYKMHGVDNVDQGSIDWANWNIAANGGETRYVLENFRVNNMASTL